MVQLIKFANILCRICASKFEYPIVFKYSFVILSIKIILALYYGLNSFLYYSVLWNILFKIRVICFFKFGNTCL